MGDMIDLVLMHADAFDEIDLDLIGRCDSPNETSSGKAAMLKNLQQRRNIVAGMGMICGKERIVVVELPHRDPVRPRGPFRRDPLYLGNSEQSRPWDAPMPGCARSRSAAASVRPQPQRHCR